jgi:hypothetical protein
MDRRSFRNRVLLDLVSSPWVLLPITLGLTSLLGAWAFVRGGYLLAMLGLVGVFSGLGALATRWISSRDKIARRAYERLGAEAAEQQARAFDDLHARLTTDGDPRTDRTLDFIRDLYARFTTLMNSDGQRPPVEIAVNIEKLLRTCIASLERSLKLWNTAQNLLTDEARQSVLDRREQVLTEVSQSVRQLAKTIDGIQTLGLERDSQRQLASLRQELEASLQVAQRVERRMQSIEDDLSLPSNDAVGE